MTTIDELTRLDREVERAERQALCDLAEYLRAAVLELPSVSKLARSFVRCAAQFERWAATQPRDHVAGMGDGTLQELNRGLRDDVLNELAAIMGEYAERLPVDDSYRSVIRRVANAIEGVV